MPKRSTIADHPYADAMLALRREGRPVREIAEKFGVAEESLKRYLRPLMQDGPRQPTADAAAPEPRKRATARPAEPKGPSGNNSLSQG